MAGIGFHQITGSPDQDATEGTIAVVVLPQPAARQGFTQANCSRLHSHLEYDGWRHGQVSDRDGSFELSRQLGNGTTFDGSASFEHCY
jgi:hypothetical protein